MQFLVEEALFDRVAIDQHLNRAPEGLGEDEPGDPALANARQDAAAWLRGGTE